MTTIYLLLFTICGLFSAGHSLICDKTETSQWRKEILKGVTQITTNGWAGQLIVFGDAPNGCSTPIVAADVKPDFAIMVAGRIGKGRIFVTFHNEYGYGIASDKANVVLFSNALRWLQKGKYDPKAQTNVDKYSPEEGKVAVQYAGRVSNKRAKEIYEFVKNGGSYFYRMYLSRTWSKDPSRTQILAHAGIGLGYDWYKGPKVIPIAANKAGDIVSVNQQARLLAEDPEANVRYLAPVDDALRNSLAKKQYNLELVRINRHFYQRVVVEVQNSMHKIPAFADWPTYNGYPIRAENEMNLVKFVGLLLKSLVFEGSSHKAYGVAQHPGDVVSSERITSVLKFKLNRQALWGKWPIVWHSTACYLAPGEMIQVDILKGRAKGWKVRVGAQTDLLYHKKKLYQFPDVSKLYSLEGNLNISSPFGGLVYFVRHKEAKPLKVKLRNCVEAPYLDITDPATVEDWPRRKHAPAPYGEVAGGCFIITAPSSSMREAKDIVFGMKQYDRACKLENHLRGRDWTKYRRERFVSNVQISGGRLHSGYPIMGPFNNVDPKSRQFVLSGDEIQKYEGGWGIFHEIGHNLQLGDDRKMLAWTPDRCSQVTTNILALYATETIARMNTTKSLDVWMKYAREYLGNPKRKYSEMNVQIHLFFFSHFSEVFGWEAYKQFFRKTETVVLTANQDKLDLWLTVMSEVVGRDLAPMFDFWTVPVSEKAKLLSRESGQAFLPGDNDVYIKLDKKHADAIANKYNAGRMASKLPDTTADIYADVLGTHTTTFVWQNTISNDTKRQYGVIGTTYW